MSSLETIQITLPASDAHFSETFLTFLSNFGTRNGRVVHFQKSNTDYVPDISCAFEKVQVPEVRFRASEKIFSVQLVNSTGEERKSPHTYSRISLDDFLLRISNMKLSTMDHVGCNLPWFSGVHPKIKELRQELKARSLYYLFPSGENWDFILPGTAEEIQSSRADLSVVRRPKFEIVSFEKDSTPLIQFEFMVAEPYENFVKLFPEGIAVKEVRCVWVYITNPCGIDICLVINEHADTDWSQYFSNHRLQ